MVLWCHRSSKHKNESFYRHELGERWSHSFDGVCPKEPPHRTTKSLPVAAVLSSTNPGAHVLISALSLLAAAWIGIPVQWKPKGNSAFLPLSRWYWIVNSH